MVSGLVSPNSIEACKKITKISALITDNKDTSSTQFKFFDSSNVQLVSLATYRVDGSGLSGNWTRDWEVPCSTPYGLYTVYAQSKDTAGNTSILTKIGSVNITAPIIVDVATPVVISANNLATSVEVCKTYAGVDVSASDDTGISQVQYRLIDSWNQVRATVSTYRKSGTNLSGVFGNNFVIPCHWPSGTYQIEAQATDSWKKASDWKNVASIAITSPTPNPVQYPMVIGISGAAAFSKSTLYTFFETVLHVDSKLNSGLTSLGHLLTAVSNTPTVCKVVSNELADLTGGIKNKTILQGLSNGTCSITWSFSGTSTRAATSKTWTGLVSGF